MKFHAVFFFRYWKTGLKYVYKGIGIRIANTILIKSKFELLLLLDFKDYYTAIVIKYDIAKIMHRWMHQNWEFRNICIQL